jgi:hypothetical protein
MCFASSVLPEQLAPLNFSIQLRTLPDNLPDPDQYNFSLRTHDESDCMSNDEVADHKDLIAGPYLTISHVPHFYACIQVSSHK